MLLSTVVINYALVISGLLFSCVIPSGPIPATLTMKIVGGDTISPIGTINLQFSDPLRDSLLSIRIVPGTYRYVAVMNATHTVGVISVPSPLSGNTEYTLIADETITSTGGGELTAKDVIRFWTIFRESEPNNSSGNADSIRSRVCGTIETVDDTDWYAVSKYPGQRLYLQESGSNSMMIIVDSMGKVVAGSQWIPRDTLVIPDSLNIPLFVVVTSYMRSAGGYYEIGIRK